MKIILSQYSKAQVKKARNIKAIFFDIDGVLSDGKIIYDETGKEIKNFSVKDGYIISHLKKAGIIVGAISGRDSGVTQKRCAELKLDFCHQGIMDKAATFEKLAKHYNLKLKEVTLSEMISTISVFSNWQALALVLLILLNTLRSERTLPLWQKVVREYFGR